MDADIPLDLGVPAGEPKLEAKDDLDSTGGIQDLASWKRVFLHAYSLVGNRAEAEDLTQETFVVLFREQNAGRSIERIGGWMRTVTKHLAYRRYREQRPDLHMSLDGLEEDIDRAPLELVDPRPSPEKQAIDQSVLNLTAQVLSEFSEHNRECILMYLSGYSFQQIGTALGVPHWKARRLTLSAFHRFQARMNRYNSDEISPSD
jgi:RNA polymerase sigma-70 factor (ECF subfamily)